MPNTKDWFNHHSFFPDERRSAINDNWVCFSCRTVFRHAKGSKSIPRCKDCGEERVWIGSRSQAPKKSDVKEWERWRASYYQRRREHGDKLRERKVRRQHRIEQELIRLRSLANEEDHQTTIRELEDELRQL